MKPSKDTSKASAMRSQILTFTVAGEQYGVSVLEVREILEYGAVTRIPRSPTHIRGVMNLRGRVVPLVDLAIRFGLPAAPPTARTCVVVVEATIRGETTVMGLIVDSVSQVFELGTDEIEPAPPFGTSGDAAFLRGMGREDGRFVLLLNVERVLTTTHVAEEASARGESTSGASTALAAAALGFLLAFADGVAAQEPIKDNSFLIEEAYNQERGVVQHVSTLAQTRGSSDWGFTFTQEWPIASQTHQVGFTLPISHLGAGASGITGVGDVALNYRAQLAGLSGGVVAFAPRLSLVVPTGNARRGLGAGGAALQVNAPVSVHLGSQFVGHANAGYEFNGVKVERGVRSTDRTLTVGQSLVWLAHRRVNILVEAAWSRTRHAPPGGPSTTTFRVSPGVRWSHDLANGLQIVPGIAFPIGLGPSRGETSAFIYLSFEHAFRSSR
jgi:chemotaxis signal transduction protein